MEAHSELPVRFVGRRFTFSLFLFVSLTVIVADVPAQTAPPDIWVSAYYAGWSQGWFNNGVLPAESIDYGSLTHIIHFALVPRSDGTFDTDANSIREENSRILVQNAHDHGVKVLICVGGWATEQAFRGATSPLRLGAFVNNLVTFMQQRGYDGIDVDWEVLSATDAPQFSLFIRTLRAALDTISPRPLLTAATSWQGAIFAGLTGEFDQINLMTYDLSGPWSGWVTWHNSPLFDGGFRFPSNGARIPSIDGMANTFATAGVPSSKLGIGLDYYGYVWRGGGGTPSGGVTQPRQEWSSYPSVRPNVSYRELMASHYRPEAYRWDSAASAPYLSFDDADNRHDTFISFDNEFSNIEKIEYVRQKGLGGVIIWELGGGVLPDDFSVRDPLTRTVGHVLARTVANAGRPAVQMPANGLVGVPLTSHASWSQGATSHWYRLQVSRDSAFTDVVMDQPWIMRDQHALRGLQTGERYFARVRGSTPFSDGPWSVPAMFETTVDTLLPASWQHRGSTGSNATLLIPANASPSIGRQPLSAGDAIGVFFQSEGRLACGGFGVWTPGENLAITAWGDDPLTASKDGFAQGDSIIIVVWNRSRETEHTVSSLTYASGDGRYTQDAILVVERLIASSMNVHRIVLNVGWNTVSTFVQPATPLMSELLRPLAGTMTLVKNGDGLVYWPDSSIADLDVWDIRDGYQIHVRENDTLELAGDAVAPEDHPIPLTAGWNLVSYLRTTPMRPDSALSSVSDRVLLAKDNEGRVYWPEFGIDAIGSFVPGRGYKIHVRGPGMLVYPPNASNSDGRAPVVAEEGLPGVDSRFVRTRHYPHVENTGSNAIVLLETPDLVSGDEVAARDAGGTIAGAGVVVDGKALVVVWGDDPVTDDRREGPVNGESLSFTCWLATQEREYPMEVRDAREVITHSQPDDSVVYRSESAVVAESRVVPTAYFLDQNFPNPFNARTTISYGIPTRGRARLFVYSILGERVAVVFNRFHEPGVYRTSFNASALASGTYLLRLQSGSFNAVRKMVLLR